MASFSLKVSTEALENKADEFWKITEDIETHFLRIGEISANSRSCWCGEAGDLDREGYSSFRDDMAYILDRLDGHASDLLKMAGIYKKAERENTAVSSQLKTDLIV